MQINARNMETFIFIDEQKKKVTSIFKGSIILEVMK